jgi:hypothetical protein
VACTKGWNELKFVHESHPDDLTVMEGNAIKNYSTISLDTIKINDYEVSNNMYQRSGSKAYNPITNHLDAQFRIIREGHVISCHSKNKLIDAVPQFKNWAVYTDDSWRNRQLSIASETPMSSWLDDDEEIALADIGFVHVNPNLVIIQRENNILCKALQKAKVDWIVAPMKYDVYFGMAVSCATAILHRTDECIDYFS